MHGTVLIFKHEVTAAWRPQFGATDIFGEDFVLNFLGQEGPKISSKWGFSGIIKSQYIEFFHFLHEVAAAWRLKIDHSDFLGENFGLEFSG